MAMVAIWLRSPHSPRKVITKVWTHTGLRSKEKRLPIPVIVLATVGYRLGEGDRESGDEEGDVGGGSRDFDREDRLSCRPDSSMYGVMDERRPPIWRASSSFSANSISTSFISLPTPSPDGIAYPSRNILIPKMRKSVAAAKFVYLGDISDGTAWPRTTESIVMTIMAGNEAEKTRRGECFIAMRHATRKVLSPISEKMIIVKARKNECKGWIKDAASIAGDCAPGIRGLDISRGSSLDDPAGRGRVTT